MFKLISLWGQSSLGNGWNSTVHAKDRLLSSSVIYSGDARMVAFIQMHLKSLCLANYPDRNWCILNLIYTAVLILLIIVKNWASA